VTSSDAVFEAATWVKRITIETQEKYGNQRNFLHKSPSIRWFRNGIHSLLRRADARSKEH